MHFEKTEVVERNLWGVFLGYINPFPHISVVTTSLVITVRSQRRIVVEKSDVRIRISIAVVEFPILGAGSVSLHTATASDRSGKETHIDIFPKKWSIQGCFETSFLVNLQTQ